MVSLPGYYFIWVGPSAASYRRSHTKSTELYETEPHESEAASEGDGCRMRVGLPYGKDGVVEVDVPEDNLLGILTPPVAEKVPDEAQAIAGALGNPLGTKRLRDIARRGAKVAVAISDATRPNIERKILPHLMAELGSAGVGEEDVAFVIGTGSHRLASSEEIAERLGDLMSCVRVVNHNARNDRMVDVGTTSSGYPIQINAAVAEADVKVAIGVVLPHPIAGYSGGGKAVLVGVASNKTIASTHTAQMLDHPNTGLGMIDGSPFHKAAVEAARLAKLDFIVNAVVNEREEIVDVAAGDVEMAHRTLVQRTADRMFRAYFPRPADIVVVSAGYPKDTNLYHVSAEGICVVAGSALPTPCVKKGGTIIVVSPMAEGVYNQTYYRWLTSSRSLDEIIERLRTEPITDPGQHRAYGVACVLRDVEVIIAQSQLDPEMIRAAHMIPVAAAREALEWALAKHGRGAEVIVVANSHRLVPTLKV